MSYHSEGIGKNKKIKEQRKKPLPLNLMIKEEDRKKYIDEFFSGKSMVDLINESQRP